jgi:hypothetical protein
MTKTIMILFMLISFGCQEQLAEDLPIKDQSVEQPQQTDEPEIILSPSCREVTLNRPPADLNELEEFTCRNIEISSQTIPGNDLPYPGTSHFPIDVTDLNTRLTEQEYCPGVSVANIGIDDNYYVFVLEINGKTFGYWHHCLWPSLLWASLTAE